MREVFGYHVKSISDHAHKELSPQEVYEIFMRDFVNLQDKLRVANVAYEAIDADTVLAKAEIEYLGKMQTVEVRGNGRLDCVSNAIKAVLGKDYVLESYVQHALEEKSSSKAASYVCIIADGKAYWGTGIHADIMTSSVQALVTAVNKML